MAGVTSAGFSVMTQAQILAQMQASIWASIDPGLDLSTETPLGQLLGITSNQYAANWELIQTLYNAFNPNGAEGVQLANLALLTGTTPNVATASVAACNLTLGPSCTVPAGSLVQVSGRPGVQFALQTTVTSTTSGTYAGTFVCTTLGPVPANASTLSVISTPVAGWSAVTNPLDAVLGDNADTNTTLRIRMAEATQASGSGSVPSLTSKLVNLAGMVNVTVLENTTLVTDGNNTPGKAIQPCIYDGITPAVSNTLIAQTIYSNKSQGTQSYGQTYASATDPKGNAVSIGFTRATQVPVYMTYTLTTNSNFPANGAALVQAAAVAFAATEMQLGSEVVALAFRYQALSVAGVVDVPSFALGTSASPTGTSNLTFTSLQVPTLETTNVVVNT